MTQEANKATANTTPPSLGLQSSISVGAFLIIAIGLVAIVTVVFNLREDMGILRREIQGVREELDRMNGSLDSSIQQQRDDWREFHRAIYQTNSEVVILREVVTGIANEVGVKTPAAYEPRSNPWEDD